MNNEFKENIARSFRYSSVNSDAKNFIFSHKDTIVCFCNANELYHGFIAVTDSHFNPIFIRETTSYPQACGISGDGNFAIFQMANSKNADASCAYFVNVPEKRIIWMKPISPNWKTITSYYIDTDKSIIYENHDRNNYEVKYRFDGTILDGRKVILQRIDGNDCSPYELNGYAKYLIRKMPHGDLNQQMVQDVVGLLAVAGLYPNMSRSQLAETHRDLGDVFFENTVYAEALRHYQKALEYNPAIAVKRKIALTEKYLSYASVTSPIKLTPTWSKIYQQVANTLQSNATPSDDRWKKELDERLSRMGNEYKEEFYRVRATRKRNPLWTEKEQDLLTLEAMERSYNYRNQN